MQGHFSSLIKSFAVSLVATALFAAPSFAQLQGPLQEGRDYNLISPPQPTEDANKIEVIEFFWYACGACYAAEGPWNSWVQRQGADVNIRKVPAMTGQFAELGSMYYTLEALGRLKDLHPKVFDAIHAQNILLMNRSKRDGWLKDQGIDPAKYEETLKSFSVVSKINRAKQLTEAYSVQSVPRFIVNGRYGLSMPQGQNGPNAVMSNVDALVNQIRKSRPAAAAAAASSTSVPKAEMKAEAKADAKKTVPAKQATSQPAPKQTPAAAPKN
jgi:protein dithiol oxidoreductase (disulfide-forming)